MAKLLEVKNLRTHFFTEEGVVRAVDGVTWDLDEGETLALVGESGCGKSVTAMSILRLIPNPPGRIVDGEIMFEGRDLLKVSDSEMRSIRGNDIAMVFQEPMTSLNPVLTIGAQIRESIQLHLGLEESEATARAIELLELVGIPEAGQRIKDYPHQFSGGMRQRVMIAMALSCNPKLLIADEPTTALDVTIQAQILEIMANLSQEFGTAVLVITHNLGVVARYADRVNVMYAGEIVESGTAVDVFKRARHPYTVGLLESVPRLDDTEHRRLSTIEGQPPLLVDPIPGCAFEPRCAWAIEKCQTEKPPLEEKEPGHKAACWRNPKTDEKTRIEQDLRTRLEAVGAVG
ncbi:MAG: ABC transporter ATP-binding protein [Chloroflexi bacterium]|nr:ABC transporter ATP-binding protein [Chloroflexota bacterium]MDA1147566.1 ABC transporter ATP-binding protein [Chloroflexota bacterium]MQC83064.1 ABC transporter ATP-binding protein [Chloroflexota bacterium]PKB56693.1 MAG: peptide ABC transporter ATP-binding protein [SAR202 cluster bacterium Casp-Chloro-G1]